MAIFEPKNPPVSDELTHVTQEMYKKNLELADRNKTLALLRKIDEVVLGSSSEPEKVTQAIAETIIAETDFNLAIIYLLQEARWIPFVSNRKTSASELERAVIDILANVGPGHPVQDALKTGAPSTHQLYELIKNHIKPGEAPTISKALGLETIFISPLMVRGKEIGGLMLGSAQVEHEISEYKHNLIERLTGVVAIAIDSSLLYQELQLANLHLKELDKAKDDFISMASHQLRTPLTTIKGYVSMVVEGDAGKVNDQQRHFLDSAMTGANRMGKMIIELLSVSRMSTGKFRIDPKPVDLGQIVADEVNQLQLHATSRNLKLIYKQPKQPINCELDEDKTRQVIMNFIDNAIFYTKQGTVTVTIDQDMGQVKFKVIDTGIGVPEDVKPKMFSKFYRAENAKIARPDGTGLGLYLAKRVIEDQGGSLIFESQVNKGSTFGFILPNKVTPSNG